MRTIHVGMSVRGAIRNGEWCGSLVGYCRKPDGSLMTRDEIFDALCDHLTQGHEMIPFGEPCDGWDWKEGCPGH